MAIIYSYPQVKPKTTDLLIGTVTYDAAGTYPVDGNPTRTFSVQDIANLAASYTLTTQQNGTSSTLTLKSDAGSLSVVNLFRGNGISLNSNGSNAITIGNLGVLSANAANTNFINMTPSSATTGNVTFSASLSASGSAGSSTYLRGDNTWATPVTTVSTASTTFIDLTPISALNGDVQISAALSASGTPTSLNFLRGDNQWAVPAGGGTVTSVNAGTGISVDNTDPDNPIVNNTGVLSNIAGTGISISGATGNSTITNTAPDQTVVITGSGDTTVTGTYPNFDISSDSGVRSIIAGSNVTISPTDGLGNVTVNAVAGGGIMAGWNLELTSPDFAPVYSTITNDYNVRISSGSSEIVMGMGVNQPTYDGTWAEWFLDLSRTSALSNVQSASDFIMFAKPELSGNPDLIGGQYKVLPSNISLSAFGAPTTNLNVGTNKLTNVVNPTDPQDAATKNYVDTAGFLESVIAGDSISIDNTDPINPIITNTAPDQVVSITGTGAAIVTGTYPDFNVDVAAGEQGVMAKDSFVSNGVETQYQLSVTPTSATYTEVFISGVYQEASTYTLSTDTITLSTAPDSGDTIEIVTFNLGEAGGGGGGGGITGSGTISYLPLFSGTTELSDSNVSFNGSVLSVASDANINGHTVGRGGNNISTNVVFGPGALSSNTTGDNNVAVGLTALSNNLTGKYNVAVGTRALNANTTSFQNTAIGFNALYLQSTGGKNTAIGSQALLSTTGDLNIGIGVNGGLNITTGRSNICIGGDSWDGFNATYNPAYNITTESNYISMGFGSTTNAYVNVAWTIVSDERDKTNFSDVPHGLEFVSKLKPISYQLKENRDSDKAVGDIKYGFKAQDILALEGDNPVIIDNKNEDKLRYNESNLIAVLVKSIQELEERIKTLETK